MGKPISLAVTSCLLPHLGLLQVIQPYDGWTVIREVVNHLDVSVSVTLSGVPVRLCVPSPCTHVHKNSCVHCKGAQDTPADLSPIIPHMLMCFPGKRRNVYVTLLPRQLHTRNPLPSNCVAGNIHESLPWLATYMKASQLLAFCSKSRVLDHEKLRSFSRQYPAK